MNKSEYQNNNDTSKQDIEIASELTFPILGCQDLPDIVKEELYKTMEFYDSRL